MREIPYSGRSDNQFTRAAQDRDRALLPEPVQALLRELFEKRDQHIQDEARLAEEIEKALTARDLVSGEKAREARLHVCLTEARSPMKTLLKKRAFVEAAALLENAMDKSDLPDDLTESEEEQMREFIRKEIVNELHLLAAAVGQKKADRR